MEQGQNTPQAFDWAGSEAELKDLVRTASLVSDMPEESLKAIAFLTGAANGNYYQEVFESLREVNALVSLCWQANMKGENDPIAHLGLSVYEKDRYIHALCWSRVFMYRAWWNLVQISFSGFQSTQRKQGKYFSFKSASALFFETVQIEEANKFVKHCGQYYEFSFPAFRRGAKLIKEVSRQNKKRELVQLKPDTQAKIKAACEAHLNATPYFLNPWQEKLVSYCRKRSTSDFLIKSQLEAFQSEVIKYFEVLQRQVNATNNGTSSVDIKSYSVIDGNKKERRNPRRKTS